MNRVLESPRFRSAALVATMACVGIFVSWVNPTSADFLPACPLKVLTDFFCPGCGAARAIHSLSHGAFGAAFSFNPYVVIILPVLMLWFGWHAVRAVSGMELRIPRIPAFIGWTLVAAVLLFTLVRNIPHPAFDVFRPTSVTVTHPTPESRMGDD